MGVIGSGRKLTERGKSEERMAGVCMDLDALVKVDAKEARALRDLGTELAECDIRGREAHLQLAGMS